MNMAGKGGLECASKAWFYNGGNQWSGWVSYLSFFRHVAKLKLDYSKFDHYETLALLSGPRWMHEDFCIISDRPAILKVDDMNRPHNDDGPFCKWRDGTALYSVHGVRVPAFVVEKPESITVNRIESERNAEVRRIMIERYGRARYLMDSGAVLVHQDHDAAGKMRKLWRKDRPWDEPLTMVEVVNSTPEPDDPRKPGEKQKPKKFKHYFLQVPPTCRTAGEAVAWTAYETESTYKPEAES